MGTPPIKLPASSKGLLNPYWEFIVTSMPYGMTLQSALTHLTKCDDLASYNEEYAKYFPTNKPTRTTVEVMLNARTPCRDNRHRFVFRNDLIGMRHEASVTVSLSSSRSTALLRSKC